MKQKKLQCPFPLTWAEINLKAIAHNFNQVKRLVKTLKPPRGIKPAQILAVVKAEGYGHGLVAIAQCLDRLGVNFLGVSNVDEAVKLRRAGIRKPILLFESTLAALAPQIVEHNLTPTICTHELAERLNHFAKLHKKKIDVHVKVDTGMGRLGVWHEDALKFIKQLSLFSHLAIKGIYTHFPSADTDRKFTLKQLDYLYGLVKQLDRKALIIPYVHAANSMGLVGYKMHILNLARPGLMLYGLYPSELLHKKISLKPAMTVKTRVIFLKKITKGRSISYGRTFIAKKNMTVATLPIGYSDGYFRAFSNTSAVLVKGQLCPVVGRVTMDQTMIDVTRIKSVALGEEVVVLGKQGRDEISADELAHHARTINYEIVCSLGSRLPRVYLK